MTNRRISERADVIVDRVPYGYADAVQIALNEAADAIDNIADMVPIGGAGASDYLPEVWTTDPYDYEINNTLVWCWLCPRCEADRADDI